MDFPNNKIILTRRGYDEMQRELNEILTVKRPAIVERIRQALQAGDLRENFDYHDAKRQQGLLEARIRDLKATLATATVVEDSESNGAVNVGSTVKVKDVEDGFEEEYKIVGSAEASPADGKISHESSVGAALMGKKAGETVEIQTPSGLVKYEIVSVE